MNRRTLDQIEYDNEKKRKLCHICGKRKGFKSFGKFTRKVDGITDHCSFCTLKMRPSPIGQRRSLIDILRSITKNEKKCIDCGERKTLESFPKRTRTCKLCNSLKVRIKYAANNNKKHNTRTQTEILLDISLKEKYCVGCSERKSFKFFYKKISSVDGCVRLCMDCYLKTRPKRIMICRNRVQVEDDIKTQSKRCGECLKRKSFKDFNKVAKNVDGHMHDCKVCVNAKREFHRLPKTFFSFSKSKYQTEGKQIATDQIKEDIEKHGLSELRYLGMPAARFRDIGQYKEVVNFNSKESLGLERNWKTYIRMIMSQKWADRLGIPFIKDMNIENKNIAMFLHEWFLKKVSGHYDYEVKKENNFNFVHLDYFGPMCPSYIQTLSAMASGDLLKEGSLFYTTINRGSRFTAKPKYEYHEDLSGFHKARLAIYPHAHKTTESVLEEFAKDKSVVFEKISENHYPGIWNNPMLQEGFKVIGKAKQPEMKWSF